MSTQELSFLYGEYWYLLVIGLLAAVGALFAVAWWRKKAAERIGDAELVAALTSSVSPWRRAVKRVLWVTGLVALGGAALRPQYGAEEAQMQGKGIDLAVVLDISNSMLVPDVAPDRLTGSVMELSDLLSMLEGGRVALIPFAGIAYTQTPLTSDFDAVQTYLQSLNPLDVPVPGTAIGRALDVALNSLISQRQKEKKPVDKEKGAAKEEKAAGVGEVLEELVAFQGAKYKAILLITDGEDHGSKPLELAKEALDRGIRIYTVGVGSEVGDMVPKLDESGEETGEKLTDPDSGNLVVSNLNEKLLKDIADTTGGKYFHYTGQPIAEAIYKEIEGLEKQEYEATKVELRTDRYLWLALPALLLLALEWAVSERRRRK